MLIVIMKELKALVRRRVYTLVLYFSIIVWLVNGLFCKVLGGVPRHEQIVGRILGVAYAHSLTILIGLLEIGMAIWIFSGIRRRWNAWTQVVVAIMNIIEFIQVPDLLLWGRYNAVFAVFFIAFVWLNEFYINSTRRSQTMRPLRFHEME